MVKFDHIEKKIYRYFEDAEDSFSGMDGEQFERVGRLLGPQQGHLFKVRYRLNVFEIFLFIFTYN